MKSVKLILLLVLVVALAAVVFQNQTSWQVRFLWLTGEVPGIILLFLTTAAGFIMGVTAALLMKRGNKQQQKGERHERQRAVSAEETGSVGRMEGGSRQAEGEGL